MPPRGQTRPCTIDSTCPGKISSPPTPGLRCIALGILLVSIREMTPWCPQVEIFRTVGFNLIVHLRFSASAGNAPMSLPKRPTVITADMLTKIPQCHHVAVGQISRQAKLNIAPMTRYAMTTGTNRSALKIRAPFANTAAPATNDAGIPTNAAMMCAVALVVLLITAYARF